MAVKVRPLHDRLIVERIEESSEQMVGGIIIPDTAKEKPQQGKVDCRRERQGKETTDRSPRSTSEPGDTVLFGKYPGQEIKLDGAEYLDHARGRNTRRHRHGRGVRKRRSSRSVRRRPRLATTGAQSNQ